MIEVAPCRPSTKRNAELSYVAELCREANARLEKIRAANATVKEELWEKDSEGILLGIAGRAVSTALCSARCLPPLLGARCLPPFLYRLFGIGIGSSGIGVGIGIGSSA